MYKDNSKAFQVLINLLIWCLVAFLFGVLFLNCTNSAKKKEPKQEVTKPSPAPTHKVQKCETDDFKIKLAYGTFSLPKSGTMPMESHFVSKDDDFGFGVWPASQSEKMDQHLKASCVLLKSIDSGLSDDCKGVYSGLHYKRVWTPAEGGQIGQGAVGNTKPSLEEELWLGTMKWKVTCSGALWWKKCSSSKPSVGTKFLVQANGKSIVAVFGYEHGPYSHKHLGGLSPEAHWFLGTNNTSKIKVSYLKDQTLKPGPINCEVE